jgi:GAF domain-containing protein
VIAAVAGGLRLRIRNIEGQSRELEREVAARTHELQALNAVAAVVSHSLDLERILGDALDKTLEVMGTEAGGIYVMDEREGVLNVAAHRGFSPGFVNAINGLAVGEGLSGHVVASGEPLVVPDVSADTRLTRMAVREEGLHSLVIAPLHSKGKMLGTLFAVTRGYRQFGAGDVQLLTSIAHQIGVALDNARFVESEQRRAEQFRVIGQVGHHITSILDVEPLLQEIAQSLHEAFGYNVVGIGLVEGNELVVKAAVGAHWQDPDRPPLRVKVGQEGVMGWVASTGQPLLVPDVRAEPRYLLWPDDAETRSELAVPLQSKSGVIGVLNVESDRLNAFDDSDLTVLQSLADQAAIALETARLFEAEQHRAEQFRVIAEVGRRITLTPDVDRVLDQVARLVQQAFGYYHVGIGVVEGDEVIYRVGAGELWDDPAFEFKPARLRVGSQGLSGWVAGSGEPLLVPDVSLEPRYVWMQGSKTRSELLVPIAVKGQVVGVLDVQSDRLDDFDDTDLAVLQALAHQVGAAIENAQLYEQAQQAAVVQERNRLARELHDAVTQTLFSASLIAEAVPDSWDNDPEEGRQLLEELRQLSRGALAEMRTLLLELRPAALVETDLCDLLRQLAEAATGREGIPITVEDEGRCRLPTEVHVALYRIAQEALNNVVKHARASQATVVLRASPAPAPPLPMGARGMVELVIRDDGRGFDPDRTSPDRLGLGIMRERAQAIGAELTIDSRPGQGTEVRAVWIEDQVPDEEE